MKARWKTWALILGSVFLLYLCMEYWPVAAGILGKALSSTIPLLVGCVMAYIINILMSFYERHYFPKNKKKFWQKSRRPVCLTLAVLTVLAIIAAVVALIMPQLVSCVKLLAAEIPVVMETTLNWLEEKELLTGELQNTLESVNWNDVLETAVGWLTSGIGSVVNVVVQAVTSVISITITTFVGLVFALYLLAQKETLKRQANKLINRFLKPKAGNKIRYYTSVLNDCFHHYIVGQCTEAVILGVLCLAGMLILRIPYAAMVSALVAFTALIPIAGAYIGAGVGAFMIMTESPVKALIFLLFLIILQQLEGNLIYPKVVGDSLDLPALWVLAAVTVGGGVLGIPGMLLGVPLTAALYRILKKAVNTPPKEKKETTQTLTETGN